MGAHERAGDTSHDRQRPRTKFPQHGGIDEAWEVYRCGFVKLVRAWDLALSTKTQPAGNVYLLHMSPAKWLA